MSGPPGFPPVPLPGQQPPGNYPVGGAPLPPHVPPGAVPVPPFPTSYGFPPPMRPMMMPGVPPGVPPVLPVPMPTTVVQKSTDVYIGKIPNTVDDETIKRLLEVCGTVTSWKRAEDPDTHQPKGFGFCTFEEAEGVLRAIRLLNDLKMDGQSLQARSSSATAKYVDAYMREKAMKGPEDKEEGEAIETEEQKDAKLKELIASILSERDESKQAKDDIPKDHESESNSHKDVESDARHYHRRRSPGLRSGRTLSRERYEMEAIIRDEESAYRKRLHEWESYERKIEKELQRERDIQRELNRERERVRRNVDMEVDSDDDRELWARRPYKNSRRAEIRRRRRRDEEAWDEADRKREVEELKEQELKRQKSEERDAMEIDAISEDPPQEPQPPEPQPPEPEPPQEPIDGLAMDMEPADVPLDVLTGSSIALTLQPKKASKPVSVSSHPTETSALKDIFGEEEEEKRPKHQIRGLAFSEIDTRPDTELEDAAKSLIETLPKTKDEIYNYAIKWEAYNSDIVGKKIETWLNKKVSEILGFEEASLTSFIMAQLDEHQPPSALEKDLAEVLDDEQQTELFIIKLYRAVIYETEKADKQESRVPEKAVDVTPKASVDE